MKRLLLLAWFVSGCGLKFGSSSIFPAPCSNDGDCTGDQVCLDIGCVAPQQNLVAQVVPPSSDTAVATQDFADIDSSKSIDLVLGPPAKLAVDADAYPFTLAISGTPLHLPDQPYAPSSPTVTESGSLPLATGVYRLLATPSDPLLPPVAASATLDQPGGAESFHVTFGNEGSLLRLDGVLTGRPLLTTSSLTYSVQLTLEDGTPVSQPALTSIPDGGGPLGFTLYLARSQQDAHLELTASPIEGGVGPIVTFDGKLEELQAAAADGGFDLGHAIPMLANGIVVDGAGIPVANAQVTLLARLPGHARYASHPAYTDASGAFQAQCLHDPDDPSGSSESYQVLVTPAPGSPLAITQLASNPVWASSVGDFGTVAIGKLADVSGRVLDSQGNPVSKAQVQATPAPQNVLPLSSLTTITGLDGTYHLALTPGSYFFDFTPPLSVQAPQASRGPIQVNGPRTSLGDLQFSVSHAVAGTIHGPDGHALSGAQVRIYFVPQGSGPDGLPQRSELLAQTFSDDDGTFTVLLPAPATHNK